MLQCGRQVCPQSSSLHPFVPLLSIFCTPSRTTGWFQPTSSCLCQVTQHMVPFEGGCQLRGPGKGPMPHCLQLAELFQPCKHLGVFPGNATGLPVWLPSWHLQQDALHSLSSSYAHSASLGTVGLRGEGGMGDSHALSQICCSPIVLQLPFHCRVFMPNLVPPKIPDGERLDFDVSGQSSSSHPWGCCSPSVSGSCWRLRLFVSRAGHSPQAHGEGPERAAGPH